MARELEWSDVDTFPTERVEILEKIAGFAHTMLTTPHEDERQAAEKGLEDALVDLAEWSEEYRYGS